MAEISVIIPSYNRSHTLPRAVESVLKQDADWELLLVDDGSTDDSEVLYKQYERDARVRVVRQEHGGVAAARNRGLSEARGKYVAFLDSDDEWLPAKLTAQLSHGTKTGTPAQQTEEIWIRRGKRVNPPKHSLKSSGDLFERSLDRCVITPSSFFCERSVLEELGGFDESFPACEDYELWLRLTARWEVDLLPEYYLKRYGGHEDQLSARYPAMDRFRIRALAKLLDNRGCSPAQKKKAREVLTRKWRIYYEGCQKRNRKDELKWCREIGEKYLIRETHDREGGV